MSPGEGMLWGSGALPASGTKALEEVGDLPKAHTFTHQPRSRPGMPRSAVVTCRAAPCCQAGTALLATPKLPGGRLRVRGASSHTGQSQGSVGMEGGHPGHGTAAPCQDTGEFAARISLRLCAQQIPGQHVKGRGYGQATHSQVASFGDAPTLPCGSEQRLAGLEQPVVLTSLWAGPSPAAAVLLFARAALGLRARQEGELEKASACGAEVGAEQGKECSS